MTINVSLSPELQSRLIEEAKRLQLDPAECARRLLDQHLPTNSRRTKLVNLLQSWIEEEDATEQKETGDFLIKALDEDRLSDRKLFLPELEGTVW